MFDSILLIESQKELSNSEIISQYPEKFDFLEDLELIKICSLPSNFNIDQSIIHYFNTINFYGNSWTFSFKNSVFSIVIISSCFRPYLFSKFLESVRESFLNDKSSDHLCKYGFILSLLQSWTIDSSNNLIVNYPLNTFTINLSEVENWTENYDISPLSSFIEIVWKNLLSNTGILIQGETSEISSSALLAILSLIEPLKYSDPMLIYTKKGDPRFEQILSGSTEYKLVSTTETNFKFNKNQFELIIKIPSNIFNPCPNLQSEYQQKTVKVFSILMASMNQSLMIDPYFDILEKKIFNLYYFQNNQNNFTPEFLTLIQKSQTFIKWRKKKLIRDQLRSSFLSVPPNEALEKVSNQELNIAKNELIKIINSSENDQHFSTVLKIHIKKINKRLKNIQ